MQNDNVFLAAKAAIVAVAGAFGAAFGALGWLVVAWVGCMVLDYLTGSAAAAYTGDWSSAAARQGIAHKAGMVVVVIVAAVCDAVIALALRSAPGLALPWTYDVLLLPVVLVWYIFTELGSVAENAAKLGAAVPAPLLRLLRAGKQAAEQALPQAAGEDSDGGSDAAAIQPHEDTAQNADDSAQ